MKWILVNLNDLQRLLLDSLKGIGFSVTIQLMKTILLLMSSCMMGRVRRIETTTNTFIQMTVIHMRINEQNTLVFQCYILVF